MIMVGTCHDMPVCNRQSAKRPARVSRSGNRDLWLKIGPMGKGLRACFTCHLTLIPRRQTTVFKGRLPNMIASNPHTKVLAVSSGGGHWSELRRLRPAWDGARVDYVVTDAAYRNDVARDPSSRSGHTPRVFRVMDANATQKLRLLVLGAMMAWVVLRVRPDVVISTGAAPGYFAIRIAKLLGARTIWVDSIANAEEMSVSANLSRAHCDLWLTQWPHIAADTGADYAGAVM